MEKAKKQKRWISLRYELIAGGMFLLLPLSPISHSEASQTLAGLKQQVATNIHAPHNGTSDDIRRPNIVFILTDDLSANLLPFMPNVLEMEREGTTFSNYFVTDSLCCPSRTSIFTGKLPHNSGVFRNSGKDGGYLAFNAHGNESQTFALTLQQAGYKTAMLGKYLNGYRPIWDNVMTEFTSIMTGSQLRRDPIPAGWNEWDVAGLGYRGFDYELNENGRLVRYGHSPEDYLTDVVARLGEAFVDATKGRPYFIEIATFTPHKPYAAAPRDTDKFQNLTYETSPAFGARPDTDAPTWLKQIPPLDRDDIDTITKIYRMRAQSVQAIDKMIGEIRSELARLGETKNTYIFFSSDNGLHMGEYSLRPGKKTPFDTDIHVPLIVIGPGVAKGAMVNELAENTDLCPTFAEIGGQHAPISADGHSLVPLLSRNEASMNTVWRKSVLVEHHHDDQDASDPDVQTAASGDPPNYEALRTKDSLYVEYDNGAHEVSYYNLSRDPYELHNVAGSLTAEKLKQLHDTLQTNANCHGAEACWSAQKISP